MMTSQKIKFIINVNCFIVCLFLTITSGAEEAEMSVVKIPSDVPEYVQILPGMNCQWAFYIAAKNCPAIPKIFTPQNALSAIKDLNCIQVSFDTSNVSNSCYSKVLSTIQSIQYNLLSQIDEYNRFMNRCIDQGKSSLANCEYNAQIISGFVAPP